MTDLNLLMRTHQLIVDACNDPDLDREALMFVVCMTVLIYESKTSATGRLRMRHWPRSLAEMARADPGFAARVIRNDIPRYTTPVPESGHRCTAPMIRRETCGKKSVVSWVERDPDTGEGHWQGLCSRHWKQHDDPQQRQRRHEQWIANGQPTPAPNVGGVLRRYFTADWPALYQWANPDVAPAEGAKPKTPPRPKLTVLDGGLSR